MLPLDEDFWDEFEHGTAYKVEIQTWRLYQGLTEDLDLAEAEAPAEPFRIAIILSAVAGHNTFFGTITVGEEELEFDQAGRLTTETALEALPEIEITDLDCQILIECITEMGAPIRREVLQPIEVVVFPKVNINRDKSGSGSLQAHYNIFTNTRLKIGDRIKYTDEHQGVDIDVYVRDVGSGIDLEDNTQPLWVLDCA